MTSTTLQISCSKLSQPGHPHAASVSHCRRAGWLAAACLLLSACTLAPTQPGLSGGNINGAVARAAQANKPLAPQLIIADLVSALSFVLPPLRTTLQVNIARTDKLGQNFIAAIAEAGYGIQWVKGDEGAHFFIYAVSQKKPAGKPAQSVYRISVGSIDIERAYSFGDDDAVVPVSALELGGSRAEVVLDDSRFYSSEALANNGALPDDVSQVTYMAAMQTDDHRAPAISLITSELVKQISDSATDGLNYQALNSSRVEVDNLYFTERSNFGSVFDNYERVLRQVIPFGDDSLRLGTTSKQLVNNVLQSYRESTDVLGVVGCSNGKTRLDIGNEGLALGRAGRVTDELLSMGVPRTDILDEGCWSPQTAGERFPSRGVVLELWREKT